MSREPEFEPRLKSPHPPPKDDDKADWFRQGYQSAEQDAHHERDAAAQEIERLRAAINEAYVDLSLLADRLRGSDEDDAYRIREALDRALTPTPEDPNGE